MTSRDAKQSDRGQEDRSPWAYAGMGFEIAAPVLAGAFIGYRLDVWLDASPWFLALGLLLGILVGFVGFFRRVWPSSRSRGNGS